MKRILAVLLLAALGAAAWAWWELDQPYRGFEQPVTIEFPKGTSTMRMGAQLAQQGVVRWGWQFALLRLLRPRARLQAGEYLFKEAASAREVFDRIERGDVFFYELLVPEGSNIFEIARIVDQMGLIKAEQFLEAARDTAPIQNLAPKARSLEGYLFPSTYRLTRHTTAAQLARMMVEQFRNVWGQLRTQADPHQTVTLASLVEKETAVGSERAQVASVYVNRLKKGMKLDCDPTTIYAALLENRYRGTIFQSDLDSRHPYNTYRNPGLPPGPIANPGLASLKAALHPAETDYLYFVAVAGANGKHQFSESFAQHQRAVSQYRRGTGQTKQTKATGKAPRRGKTRRR